MSTCTNGYNQVRMARASEDIPFLGRSVDEPFAGTENPVPTHQLVQTTQPSKRRKIVPKER